MKIKTYLFALLFTITILIPLTVDAQNYQSIKIRVRYQDGSPAEGIKIAIYFDEGIPDNDGTYVNDCIIGKSGICEFLLEGTASENSFSPYLIKFPEKYSPDPQTQFGLGTRGLSDYQLMVNTKGFTKGFVISTLLEEEAEPTWILLDLTPEENTPSPHIPDGSLELARVQAQDQATKPEATIALPTEPPTQIPTTVNTVISIPTIEPISNTEEIAQTNTDNIQTQPIQNQEPPQTTNPSLYIFLAASILFLVIIVIIFIRLLKKQN